MLRQHKVCNNMLLSDCTISSRLKWCSIQIFYMGTGTRVNHNAKISPKYSVPGNMCHFQYFSDDNILRDPKLIEQFTNRWEQIASEG